MSGSSSATVPDHERFARSLAELLVLGLTTYVPMLRLLSTIGEGDGDGRQMETLEQAGRRIGLELLAFAQVAPDLASGKHDPAPVLELARRLGTGVALLLRVVDAESARDTPVTSISAIQEVYDQGAREWLARYVPVIPEFVEDDESTDL